LIVALDGRSGVGKSTLARELAGPLLAEVLQGDDFYAGGVNLRGDSARERTQACIDWPRQRSVLEALRENTRAAWYRFDWQAFDGSLESVLTYCDPAPVILFEGVYSARPELADLVDFRVLLRVPADVQMRQLIAREGAINDWERQWHEAEDYYFANDALADAFDLVVDRA
jgi:uridine kinase